MGQGSLVPAQGEPQPSPWGHGDLGAPPLPSFAASLADPPRGGIHSQPLYLQAVGPRAGQRVAPPVRVSSEVSPTSH